MIQGDLVVLGPKIMPDLLSRNDPKVKSVNHLDEASTPGSGFQPLLS